MRLRFREMLVKKLLHCANHMTANDGRLHSQVGNDHEPIPLFFLNFCLSITFRHPFSSLLLVIIGEWGYNWI